MSDHIFVVVKDSGCYSDYTRDIVCAFRSKRDADDEVTRLSLIVEKRVKYNNALSAFTSTGDGSYAKLFPPPVYVPPQKDADKEASRMGEWQKWSDRREAAAEEYMQKEFPELSDKENPASFFDADETYSVEEIELKW